MDGFNQWLIFQQFGKIAGIQIQIKTTANLNDKYRVQSLVYNVWDVCEIVSVRCVEIEPV